MGQLIEQTIKSIFNGVSRQPHNVRLSSQVEQADNAMFSVVTSGFEKRPPTTHLAVLAGLDPVVEYCIHTIDRDASERYLLVLGSNTLRVYDALTGTQKSVTIDSGAAAYLSGDPIDLRVVSVADYTFILNTKKKIVMGAADTGTLTGTAQNFNKLPTSPATGDVYHVTGDASTSFDDYYVKWDGTVWLQAVDPKGVNTIDASTMPHKLVRKADGTFQFSRATWEPRKVGDADSVVAPGFIDKYPSDVFFYRGRLGIASDEGCTMSQAGDVFNFWPDKAITILDSDPIEVQASTNKVTLIRHSVPFRKTLFVTSDSVQFEIGSEDKLTPKTASITPTTSYQIDIGCKPVGMGDQLYFCAESQGSAIVYEYYYDGNSFSNTAADVTKHCLGYVPGGVRMLTASAATQRLFLMPKVGRNHLYCYTSYWNGTEKAMSAWGRYSFGDSESEACVLGMSVMADNVYLVMRRNAKVVLETLPVDSLPNDAGAPCTFLLDRRVWLTGVHDSGTNRTTWTTPYLHGGKAKVVKGGGWTTSVGAVVPIANQSGSTITAVGDHSAHPCLIGVPYAMSVELSKLYIRDQNAQNVFTGRCQMRNVSFQYRNTGYFEVHVTPDCRPTKVWKMTGRIIGSAKNAVGMPAIEDNGRYTAKVETRSDTATIKVVNDSPFPSTITGLTWEGFYNNISKQG